uniref:Uncharacterized protein n=1 Tax=Setaria viridis TaxID=4556 RepID=A0A4U6TYK5_SETVI|nr:hypothetical protein SEVIR_7G237066v2 [Setaria viridis]
MSCHIQCCLFFFGFMPFFIRTASSSRLEASRTFRLPLWCSSDPFRQTVRAPSTGITM